MSMRVTFRRIASATRWLALDILIVCWLGAACIMSSCPPQCRCSGTVVRCTHQNLRSIPDDISPATTELDLSNNALKRLYANSSLTQLQKLGMLNLSKNKITVIESGALSSLKSLSNLNLYGNLLSNEAVKHIPTSNLKVLNLVYNSLTEVPLLCNASQLNMLTFSNNYLTHFYFPACYRRMTSLRILSMDNISNRQLVNFTKGDLHSLNCETIVEFSCQSCNLTSIESGIFQRFTHLKTLNIGYNRFDYTALHSIISDLASCTDLDSLNLSGNVNGYDLTEEFFKPLNKLPLRTLYFRKFMPLTGIKRNTFTGLANLTSLWLDSSHIAKMENGALAGLNSLIFLTLTYSYGMELPPTAFPPSLLELNLSHNFIHVPNDCFTNLLNLKTLIMRHCTIFNVDATTFGENNSLEVLDLYNTASLGNRINLTRLKKLIFLNMSKNSVTDKWLEEQNRFKGLTELQHIKLSENDMTTLPPDVFVDNVKLKSLHLDQNLFSHWTKYDGLFKNCKDFEYLNLSQNQIATLDESFLASFSNRGERQTQRLAVSLQGNLFVCDCSLLWFRTWLDSNSCTGNNDTTSTSSICVDDADRLMCHAPGFYAGQPVMSIHVLTLRVICLPWYYYVCAAVVVCLILAAVCYRYRWYIRWMLYRCGHSKSDLLLLAAADSETTSLLQQRYDVYVSCVVEDEPWADEMASKIESNFTVPTNVAAVGNDVLEVPDRMTAGNRPIAVYYGGRAIPGEPEFDQMTRAIYMSRTAIVGLSVEYLRDRKCQFELNLIGQVMAEKYGQAANDHIVLVALAESGVLMHLLPPHLRSHFVSKSLSWSDTDVTQQQVFFSDLQRRLSS